MLKTIGTTKCYPWKLAARLLRPPGAGNNGVTMNDLSSGGSWQTRARVNYLNLSKLFPDGGAHGLKIAPFIETGSANVTKMRFGVVTFKGQNCNFDRICRVSATTGNYAISAVNDAENNAVPLRASSFYFKALTLTNDYAGATSVPDGATSAGKAQIKFDLEGATGLGLFLISSTITSASLGYDLSPY